MKSYIYQTLKNLISLRSLDDDGYTMMVEKGKMKVVKGSIAILKANKVNDIYMI